jgi:hypothetical protein
MKAITLRINDNLHIVGNRVISYETEVALIKEDAIYAYGRYSRTTGKQLGTLSRQVSRKLIVPNNKAEFDKYEQGWVPDLRIPDAISPDSSRKILAWMGTGYDIVNATAAAWSTIKPVDRKRALANVVDIQAFNELVNYYTGLLNLGLATAPIQC